MITAFCDADFGDSRCSFVEVAEAMEVTAVTSELEITLDNPNTRGDGYFRSLSNRSEVIIRGKRYPVIGQVCMDQMMVNIEWETAYNGDEVVLVGEWGDPAGEGPAITCNELAEWAGTVPYEILTNISSRVDRIYFTA